MEFEFQRLIRREVSRKSLIQPETHLFFVFWIWRRRDDRPGDMLGTLSGMVLESVAFALGLWALSRALAPVLDQFTVAAALSSGPEAGVRQILPYIGAGIYEESLFRLGLYSLLLAVFLALEAPDWLAACAQLLRPLYDLLVLRVLQSRALHTDDTPVNMQELVTHQLRTARLWVYVGDAAHPYNVFDFTTSRQRDGPQRFLKDYAGYLHAGS